MSVRHVEFLVEERSMETALRLLAPKILGDLPFQIHSHQGKRDLLSKLPQRLRGYAQWLPQDSRIVVIVDRDSDDCHQLKARLERSAREAGLSTRTNAKSNGIYTVVNRLAIEELEAWYFGDWKAVRAAYPRLSVKVPKKAPYRDPDAIRGGTWEAFERLLQRAGYFKGGLRKIEAARAIAQHWEPTRNTSTSFRVLQDVLKEMTI